MDCPYAVVSSESARTHDLSGHTTAIGLVQKVGPQTYWKVTHGFDAPFSSLPSDVASDIGRQVKELFRPTLPQNVQSLSTM
jgi:hypothetical protein